MTSGQPEDQHGHLCDRLVVYYRHVVAIHSDNPVVGACPSCRGSRCEDWRFASERLWGFAEQQTEQATDRGLCPATTRSQPIVNRLAPICAGDVIEVSEADYS